MALNVNTISPSHPDKPYQLFQYMKENNVDIGLFSEPNLNFSLPNSKLFLNQMLDIHWVHNKLICTSTPDNLFYKKYNQRALNQPGGSFVVLNQTVFDRDHKAGSDPYGRWAWVKLKGKQKKHW